MNMYLYELKTLRKSTIAWTLSMIGLASLFLSMYPSMARDAEDLKELLSGYPESIRAILGINLDYIASLLGFYTMVFSFIILCGAIQAMNLGVSILSRESRERTADFLLVKPVTRSSIVSAKLLAAFTSLVFTNIGFFIVTTLLANLVKNEDFSQKLFFLINFTIFLVQLIFVAIGMFVSVFFQKIKNVLPISLGFVFGFYMIGALLAVDSDDKIARILSPFKYFNVTYIIENGSYEIVYLLLSAVIILVTITASYVIYNKKDIHAVS